MIFKVWKYELPPLGDIVLEIPSPANILTVQAQDDALCLWALVNPESPKAKRRFQVVGTGHPIEADDWHGLPLNYIGTVQLYRGSLVFHVFERFD